MNKFLLKVKNLFSGTKKIKSNDLENITGAGNPEEFDWKSKGYETPIKPKQDDGWDFQPIGPNNTLSNEELLKELKNNSNISDADLKKVTGGGSIFYCPSCKKLTFHIFVIEGRMRGTCPSCHYSN